MEEQLVFMIQSVAEGLDKGFLSAADAAEQLGDAYDLLTKKETDAKKSSEAVAKAQAEAAKTAAEQAKALEQAAKAREKQARLEQQAAQAGLREAQALSQLGQANIDLAAKQRAVEEATVRLNQAKADAAHAAEVAALKEIEATQATDNYARAQKQAADATRPLTHGMGDQQNQAIGLAAALTALYGMYRMVKSGLDAATESYNRNRAAMVGLQSIVEGTGGSFSVAKKGVDEFIEDGLVPAGDAATALKNLLARGFSMEESLDLMNRFKDSAAFGRQASLELGDAVRSATEGLKNENSILVDNAGVTKNVSVMWKEYAAEIGKSVNDLTLAEKRQAEYNGIMRETRHQVGDAKKLSREFAGSQASLTAVTTRLSVAIGQANATGLAPYNRGLTTLISGTADFVKANNPVISVVLSGAKAFGVGVVATMLFNGSLKALVPSLLAVVIGEKNVEIASKAMWTAITGPIGIAVAVIGTIVGIFSAVSASAAQSAEDVAALNDEVQALASSNSGAAALVDEYEMLSKKVNRSAEETNRMESISRELVNSYGMRADGISAEGEQIITNLSLMRLQLEIARQLEASKRDQAKAENEKVYNQLLEEQVKRKERLVELNNEIRRLTATKEQLDAGTWGKNDYGGYAGSAVMERQKVESRLPARQQEYQELLTQSQNALKVFSDQAMYAIEDAKIAIGAKAAEIPETAYAAMQQKLVELSQAGTDTTGMAQTFMDNYLAIDEAAVLETKVPEILALKESLVAALATAPDADPAAAGAGIQAILGNITDESTLAQALSQGQALRQKIDQGIATAADLAAYDQMRASVKSEIDTLSNQVKAQGQQLKLPVDGVLNDLNKMGDGFTQTAAEIQQAAIEEKVSKMDMSEFVSQMEGAMGAAEDMRKSMSDWADLQSAIDVVSAGADATDNYSAALEWLAEKYGVTEEEALANLDAYQAEADMTSVLIDIKMALAEAEIATAQATIEAMVKQDQITRSSADSMIGSLNGVLQKLNQLNGKRIQFNKDENGGTISVTGGDLNPFSGNPSWLGGGGGGRRRSSGGGGGGGGRRSSGGGSRASAAEKEKNEALEREMKLLERKKKLDQLTTAEELEGLQRILIAHAKTADERQDIEEKLHDVRKRLLQEDLSYRKAMDQLTIREEIDALQKQMELVKAGSKAHQDLEQQAHALKKELRRQEYDLAVHYGKLTLEQQAVQLRQMINQYKAGTKARLDLEKELFDKQQEIKSRDAATIDTFAEQMKTALRNRYAEQQRIEEERINKSIKAWADWGTAQQEAIQKQIAAMDELTQSEDRAEEERKRRRDIAATRQKLQYETDAYNRRKLQEELARQETELSKWLARNQREDQKKALNEQSQAVGKRAQKEQEALSKQLEANQKYYESLTTDAQLNAEVKRYMGNKDQQYIIKLLKNFAPDYNAAGKTLGEQLVDGFKSIVGDIPKWFETLNKPIKAYQDRMAKVANAGVMRYWNNRNERPDRPADPKFSKEFNAGAPVLHIYFNQPVESPAQVTRELERLIQNLSKQK